jgi:hypothetical protein
VAVPGDELDSVIADQLARCAVLGDGGFHGPPGGGSGEPAGGGGADGEAGVVVEDVDLRAVYLPQVIRCVAFEAARLGY